MKFSKILFIVLGMAFILSCKPGEDGPDAIIGNSISVPNEVTTVRTGRHGL